MHAWTDGVRRLSRAMTIAIGRSLLQLETIDRLRGLRFGNGLLTAIATRPNLSTKVAQAEQPP